MDVLPDAAGPRDAVVAAPPRASGSVRRTTNIDTLRPDGLLADALIDARARDLRTNHDGTSDVVATATLQARVSPTSALLSIRTSPDIPALQALVGSSVGAGFRSRFSALVTEGCEDGSLLYLLLDDLPGATLVSGYALHRGGALDESAGPRRARREPVPIPVPAVGRPAGTALGPFPDFAAQNDICAGWAHDATMMVHLRDTGSLPVPLGPPAPSLEQVADPQSWHQMAELGPHAVRRRRRLDLVEPSAEGQQRIDLHFRDSHVDVEGCETIMHEYTVAGTVDMAAGRIGSISARANVLPWMECPGALASAQRLNGMELSGLRTRVRKEFVGRSTCTHLNDSLRSLADVTALHLVMPPPA